MFHANTTTIKPGMLVSLKTTVSGNVHYRRHTIEAERVTADGALHGKWETEKHVMDAAEHDRAKKARADARNAISAACSHSSFGLLCAQENATKLQEAITKAQSIVSEFNATAKLSRISVYVITGKIAADDVQAVQAINSEILELLMEMDEGLEKGDVKIARDACNKARDISDMLTEVPAATLRAAIDMTREAARRIVKNGNAGDAGEQARAKLGDVMAYFAQ
jgi:hypothetical protein